MYKCIYIIGHGEKSCYDSIIVLEDDSSDIECYGMKSCSFSDITCKDHVQFKGVI